jgi:hypothetical protein
MIKKFLLLIVLCAAGYVGYLVWNKLGSDEQGVIKDKIGNVVNKTKKVAETTAEALTEKTKDVLKVEQANQKQEEPGK